MSRHETTTYYCDKCGKKLKTCNNEMTITTSLSENMCWARLHLQIIHISGVHNNGETKQAELCKACAVALLEDALKRVRAGERSSKGWESSDMEKWE